MESGRRNVAAEQIENELVVNAQGSRNVLEKQFVRYALKGDTTPSVLNVERVEFRNDVAVLVTDLRDGQNGQQITVFGDGFTTLQENAKIANATGADQLLGLNVPYIYTRFNDGKWHGLGGSSGGVPVDPVTTNNPPENLPLHAGSLQTFFDPTPYGYTEPFPGERTAALIKGHKAARVVVDVITPLGTCDLEVRYGLADEAFAAMSSLGVDPIHVDLSVAGVRRGAWIPLNPAVIGVDATLAWAVFGPDDISALKIGSVKLEFDDAPLDGSRFRFSLTGAPHPNPTWAGLGIFYLELGLPTVGGPTSFFTGIKAVCGPPGAYPRVCKYVFLGGNFVTPDRIWRSLLLDTGFVNADFIMQALAIVFNPFTTWGRLNVYFRMKLVSPSTSSQYDSDWLVYSGVGSLLNNRTVHGFVARRPIFYGDYFEVQITGAQIAYITRPDDGNTIEVHHGGGSFNSSGDNTAGMLEVLGSVRTQ